MGPGKEKIKILEQRMLKLGIKKEDIKEKFIKASGRGGQKVNKSSCAVFIKHIPTGISVKCGSERSQSLNRFLALRRLVDNVEAARSGKKSTNTSKIEKMKKQKRKRKKRSQTKYENRE
ncbi:MAG: peptide chain release factor-like protein [Thermodesulfobacteriota bacterium]|nr:peptide chain release factor-like protein [Thermodesulfobacteriota bacterium]